MEVISQSYKEAGVDVGAGYEAVKRMRKHVERTQIAGVLEGIGGFGGLFAPNISAMKEPVLVSGTDGVGTKLRLAFALDTHHTIGIDCVAMCVNDIICTGATPLFFLDYLALGKNKPERVEHIVAGVAEGCVQAGCALIGGETAEMPGFYAEDEYDIAGFAVGMVDREKIIDKQTVQPGDTLLAVASSGVHSNGFSLIRHILGDSAEALREHVPALGTTLGDTLLTPTKIYVKAIKQLLTGVKPHSIAHITGGGFYENIPRALPEGMGADITRASLQIPPIFTLLQSRGMVSEQDMFATFNMGMGLCIVVSPADQQQAIDLLTHAGETVYPIGVVTNQHAGVEFV